jgi:hypothetical protein
MRIRTGIAGTVQIASPLSDSSMRNSEREGYGWWTRKRHFVRYAIGMCATRARYFHTFASQRPTSACPGERTGRFRLGGNQLVIGPDGQSRISCEDYAMALLDEAEIPRHIQQRFSISY